MEGARRQPLGCGGDGRASPLGPRRARVPRDGHQRGGPGVLRSDARARGGPRRRDRRRRHVRVAVGLDRQPHRPRRDHREPEAPVGSPGRRSDRGHRPPGPLRRWPGPARVGDGGARRPRALAPQARATRARGAGARRHCRGDGHDRPLRRPGQRSGELARLPIDDATHAAAARVATDATSWATSGGEDYELLVTVRPAALAEASAAASLTVIGEITAAGPVQFLSAEGRATAPPPGFEHFSGRPRPSPAGPEAPDRRAAAHRRTASTGTARERTDR